MTDQLTQLGIYLENNIAICILGTKTWYKSLLQGIRFVIKVEEMPERLIFERLAIVHKKQQLVEDLNLFGRKQNKVLIALLAVL